VQEVKQAAIYARTATPQETGSNFPIAQQIHQCKEYAESKGYSLTHIYEDVGSGNNLARHGVTSLRQAVKNGVIDVVIVTSTERFTRTYRQLEMLLAEFKEHHVKTESVEESASNETTIKLEAFASMRQADRQRIAERMKRGKQAETLKDGQN
jgi:site-specific DNA recombinase